MLSPEVWVEGATVCAEENVGFADSLKQCGAGNAFVIGVGDDHEGTSEQGSEGVHASVVMRIRTSWRFGRGEAEEDRV